MPSTRSWVHSDFEANECCGCLFPVILDDQAEITCNKCGAVVKSVPVTELERTFGEMERSLDVATAICPHCHVSFRQACVI